jgi:hypothetical protein
LSSNQFPYCPSLHASRPRSILDTPETIPKSGASHDHCYPDPGSLHPKLPPLPQNWKEVIEAFEKVRTRTLEGLREASEESLGSGTVPFLTGPKTPGQWPKMEFLWFLLLDQIHHRGQLSIYLRIAGGKLPSIYGPTADEPWS